MSEVAVAFDSGASYILSEKIMQKRQDFILEECNENKVFDSFVDNHI